MLTDQLNDILNSNNGKSTLIVFCRYVRDHLEEIPNMTIDQIAKDCFISKGQVSKLVKELDYQSYEEFILDCKGYIHSKTRRKQFYNSNLSITENNKKFTNELSLNLIYMTEHLDLSFFQSLIQDIQQHTTIYLFARGEARMASYNLQREFKYHNKPCFICDAEFKKEYHFNSTDLLLFISTNGDTLLYDKRIYHRVTNAKVDKWLITCNPNLKLDHTLLLTSNNNQYNPYLIRHFFDLLSLYL